MCFDYVRNELGRELGEFMKIVEFVGYIFEVCFFVVYIFVYDFFGYGFVVVLC